VTAQRGAPPTRHPDAALVNHAPQAASVVAVVEQARPRLVRVLKAHRIPATDGEDLLQDAFVALLELARALGQARPLSVRRARYRALRHLRALFDRMPPGKI
jgi:DNA-directed RNA polymerase specialized sigma24 family protein